MAAPIRKKQEFVVKATNLSSSVTEATLKIALESWGITGIGEVQIAPSRHGAPMALVKFRSENDAEKMLQARGVAIDGKPLVLEAMRTAAPAKPGAVATKGTEQTPILTTFVKVASLPKEINDKEIVTFLRQYGVLGIIEAQLVEEEGYATVEFQTADNVKSAIAKADGKQLKGSAVTIEPHAAPARRAQGEGSDWNANGPIGAWSIAAPTGPVKGGCGVMPGDNKPRWGPYDRPGVAPPQQVSMVGVDQSWGWDGGWNEWNGKGRGGCWEQGGWGGGKGGYGKM